MSENSDNVSSSSNCNKCEQPIEEGAKVLEMPCCIRRYHAACGIHMIGYETHYSDVHTVYCGCGSVLYQCPETHFDNDTEGDAHIAEVMAKPEVPNEIKNIKAKVSLENKALVPFRKLIHQKYREFFNTVNPQLTLMKQMRKQALADIRASDISKAYRRALMAKANAINKFQKTHELRHYMVSKILGRGMWGLRRHRGMSSFLLRKFRIRL